MDSKRDPTWIEFYLLYDQKGHNMPQQLMLTPPNWHDYEIILCGVISKAAYVSS